MNYAPDAVNALDTRSLRGPGRCPSVVTVVFKAIHGLKSEADHVTFPN